MVGSPAELGKTMKGPIGLPLAASAHAGEVDDTMVIVHILMAVLFVGWILFFAFALYRFRRSRFMPLRRQRRRSGLVDYTKICLENYPLPSNPRACHAQCQRQPTDHPLSSHLRHYTAIGSSSPSCRLWGPAKKTSAASVVS